MPEITYELKANKTVNKGYIAIYSLDMRTQKLIQFNEKTLSAFTLFKDSLIILEDEYHFTVFSLYAIKKILKMFVSIYTDYKPIKDFRYKCVTIDINKCNIIAEIPNNKILQLPNNYSIVCSNDLQSFNYESLLDQFGLSLNNDALNIVYKGVLILGTRWPISILSDVYNILVASTKLYNIKSKTLKNRDNVLYLEDESINEFYHYGSIHYKDRTYDKIIYNLKDNIINADHIIFVYKFYSTTQLNCILEKYNANYFDINNDKVNGYYTNFSNFTSLCDDLDLSKQLLQSKKEWFYYTFPKSIEPNHDLQIIKVLRNNNTYCNKHISSKLITELQLTINNDTVTELELADKLDKITKDVNLIKNINNKFGSYTNILKENNFTIANNHESILNVMKFYIEFRHVLYIKYNLHEIFNNQSNEKIELLIKLFHNIINVNTYDDINIKPKIKEEMSNEEILDLFMALFDHTVYYILFNYNKDYLKNLLTIIINDNKDKIIKMVNQYKEQNYENNLSSYMKGFLTKCIYHKHRKVKPLLQSCETKSNQYVDVFKNMFGENYNLFKEIIYDKDLCNFDYITYFKDIIYNCKHNINTNSYTHISRLNIVNLTAKANVVEFKTELRNTYSFDAINKKLEKIKHYISYIKLQSHIETVNNLVILLNIQDFLTDDEINKYKTNYNNLDNLIVQQSILTYLLNDSDSIYSKFGVTKQINPYNRLKVYSDDNPIFLPVKDCKTLELKIKDNIKFYYSVYKLNNTDKTKIDEKYSTKKVLIMAGNEFLATDDNLDLFALNMRTCFKNMIPINHDKLQLYYVYKLNGDITDVSKISNKQLDDKTLDYLFQFLSPEIELNQELYNLYELKEIVSKACVYIHKLVIIAK